MELKEEKMLQVEETSGTEGQGAVSKPVTSTDQIITLDRLAASAYENDNETDDLNWHELQNSMLKQKILTGILHILAEAQKKGGEVAFIDVEHALDPAYASALGVNIDELLVSQPDTGEQAMEICEE